MVSTLSRDVLQNPDRLPVDMENSDSIEPIVLNTTAAGVCQEVAVLPLGSYGHCARGGPVSE